MSDQRVALRLEQPPLVVNAGLGVHGIASLRDVFTLPSLWQLHLYRYTADLVIDGTPHRVRTGCVSLAPPGSVVEYRYLGRSEHLYVHFRASDRGTALTLPTVQHTADEASALSSLLSHVAAQVAESKARACAELWTALWRVAALSDAGPDPAPPPAVAAAVAHIEAHLAGPLSVAHVARAVNVSHNHLTRLFRAHTGRTVVAYIRHRRMERARHLLQESTLPVATIAVTVGIPDLQAFNKTCRRELGASPRFLAEQAGRGR